MRPCIALPGILLVIAILFTGCTSEKPGGIPLPTPIDTTPTSQPVTTPVTPSATGTVVPLTTPGQVGISIQASPQKYSPLMSSTVGIGLTPQYTGSGPVVYSWNTSYGHFISWNAPDWKVNPHNETIDTTNQTVYWSYSPEDMGKEKPPVTIRLIIKTPPRTHGGSGTIARKDIHISWEQNDTAVVTPEQVQPRPLPATIRQVDHLMVQVPQPDRVYHLFSEDLGLPVAWPMVSYGPFSTGGVSFGNVNMEVLNSSDEMKQQGLIPKGNGIVGVAFQPLEPVGPTAQVLDAHQVAHGAITPFNITQNGTPSTLWYNLELSGGLPGSMIFYCEYTFNQTGFRQRMEQSLASVNGGALGITRMKEITIEYADPAVLEKWQMLLPEAAGGVPERRDGGDGVTVHLKKSDRDAISSITLQVKSLDQAKSVLTEKGLLGPETDGKISMNPDAIEGLRVFVTG